MKTFKNIGLCKLHAKVCQVFIVYNGLVHILHGIFCQKGGIGFTSWNFNFLLKFIKFECSS